MKPIRIAPLATVIAFLVAVVLGWVPGRAWAATVESHFGSVGLTNSETALVNVVSLFPTGPCTVNVEWLDTNGNVLHQSALAVATGQTRSATLTTQTVGRVQVRAVVQWLPSPFPPDLCRTNSVLTLETVDNATGRTLIVIPPGP
jgi:hypothetical protein